jgi:hypothetical protein
MELEQTTETQALSENEIAQRELDELMGTYKTPAKSLVPVVEKVEDKTPENLQVNIDKPIQQIVTPTISNDPDAPYGRYLRGKKKGQARTTPYISAKGVSSVPMVQTPQEPPKLSGMLISGGLFLMLVNLCLPLFFAMCNNFLSKDKINPEHLKLTKEQIKELDPVCDAAMKQASITGNPIVLLFMGIFAAMGMNYMMWKMKTDANGQSKTTKPIQR